MSRRPAERTTRVGDLSPDLVDEGVACLDPIVGSDRFDFVQDLGAELPMRTIGMRDCCSNARTSSSGVPAATTSPPWMPAISGSTIARAASRP